MKYDRRQFAVDALLVAAAVLVFFVFISIMDHASKAR